MTTDYPGLLHYPATERNKVPLLEVLKSVLPLHQPTVNVLEIASGSGQHASYFTPNLPSVTWQPSDCDPDCLKSIEIYSRLANKANYNPPIVIDVSEDCVKWAGGSLRPSFYNAVFCANLIHISPWKVTEGLFKGSGYYLKEGGTLLTYGPYRIHGKLTPESNVQFDQSLRLQNSSWGVRDVDSLEKLAAVHGLKLEQMIDMPANNKTLVFRKQQNL
jgi:hypothetical protein